MQMERPTPALALEPDSHRVSEVQLFREDVVKSMKHPARIGMVTRVGGDSSDSDSSDSDEDNEEDEDGRDISEGSARIVWVDSKETTESVSDICVVDRAFMHGDIVAAASNPLGQTGIVVDVDMSVELELLNKDILKDFDSRRLRRVRAFTPGDYVINGHWLGRVEEVMDNVTVLFDDGSKCKVLSAEPDHLVPNSESLMDDTESPYYPGQRVRATSSGVFKSAKWLRGSWKANFMEGTVVDVEAGTVIVYWIAVSATHSSAVPAEQQEPRNLVPMTYFSHTNWQIGDRTLLPEGFQVNISEGRGVTDGGSETAPIVMDSTGVDTAASEASVQTVLESAVPEQSGSCEEQPDNVNVQRQRRSTKQQLRRASKKERKALRKEKIGESAALVVNTKTSVDILWQDGTRSSKVNACSLIPVDHLGDHDFWPEQYVLEQGSDGDGLDNEVRRVGILKSVDAKQRTAIVRWLKVITRPEELREFGEEETMSVYELVEHPDYTYCLGDVVIRLSPGPSIELSTLTEDSEGAASSGVDGTEQDADVKDKEGEAAEKQETSKNQHRRKRKGHLKQEPVDLSWVGIIIGLQDGDIEVAWANGIVSKVGPQAVFVVTRDDDDISSAHTSDLEDGEDDNDGDDAASWETVDSSDERDREAGVDPGSDDRTDTEGEEDRTRNSYPMLDVGGDELPVPSNSPRPFRGPIAAAIGLISRMATGLLGFRGGNSEAGNNRNGQVCGPTKHGLEEILDDDEAGSSREPRHVVDRMRKLDSTPGMVKEEEEDKALPSEHGEDRQDKEGSGSELSRLSAESETRVDNSVDKESQEVESPHEEAGTLQGGRAEELAKKKVNFVDIPHFDSVSDPSDHHYVGESAQSSSQRRWVKKIQSEWIILERGLPDTIYVRIYEDRMDLLRAVILGAPGTPYHDGLFIFDLYLPPEYPHTPPLAHYHSGGLRLNPNLYESGKVCLSLLNTWTGKGTEVWDPSTSSILQILVSIQGLVLNAKPYFNEAGYDRQVGTLEGEKNSVVYNENAFLLSCKSMLYLLRRPPMHFEDLIQQSFVQRGAGLLQSCEAYLQGAPVGSLGENKNTSTLADTELVGADKSSVGFKLMLKKLVVKLKAAFSELGIDCSSQS